MSRLVLFVLILLATTYAQAQDPYTGKIFRVTGNWTGTELQVSRIQLREPEDAKRVRIAGRAERVDAAKRSLSIGPLAIEWNDKTEFEALAAKDIKAGALLQVTGPLVSPGCVLAAKIERETSRFGPREVQLTAQAHSVRAGADAREAIGMAGVRVPLAGAGYNRVESLTLRQDSRRREQPLALNLAGRPLAITGEYTFGFRERDNFDFDDVRRSDVSNELGVEFFYPFSKRVFAFADVKLFDERDLSSSDGGSRDIDNGIGRGQSWILFDGFAQNRMMLQLGRQNFRETREWWWDDDLDGVRAYFDQGPLHVELGAAQELLRTSTNQKDIDPEQKGVRRFIGQASWLWASRQAVELYALRQNDSSSRQQVGDTVRERDEDESDANLTWFGVRAIGQRAFSGAGTIRYWADVGMVRGRETVFDYNELDNGLSEVDSRERRDVRGHGYDVGVSWQLPLKLRPALTASYASGSGDDDEDDGTDHAFRQTGLHANKGRFFGVNRFRYYGELMRPELSNLSIGTLALGLPFFQRSSVELVYHRYRQVKAADSMRDIRLDENLTGNSRDLGSEFDVVFGFRDLERWDFSFAASRFKAGDAYGAGAGKHAYLYLFEMSYNF